ncbi:flagellar biosynthetic protein FliR [Frateuria aurantia]
MHWDLSQLDHWMAMLWWPLGRVSGLMLTAPILSATTLPSLVRVVLTMALTVAIIPAEPALPALTILSWQSLLILAQQFIIGLLMGTCLKLVFEAVNYGGELVANAMGLGFASAIDPQQNSETPLVGQFHTTIVSLLFLVMNGHLALIGLLADSLHSLPPSALTAKMDWQLLSFAGIVFSGAVRIALTAMIALMVTNIGFGVISRAAPSMNMFALGFPISITLGLAVLWLSLRTLPTMFTSLCDQADSVLRQIIGQ